MVKIPKVKAKLSTVTPKPDSVDRFKATEGQSLGDSREMALNKASSTSSIITEPAKEQPPQLDKHEQIYALPSGATTYSYYDNLNPADVEIWEENTRADDDSRDLDLEADIQSTGGNKVAVGIRLIERNGVIVHQLIYGRTRLKSCTVVGKKLYALILKNVSDADAWHLMMSENKHKQPNNWRKANSYMRAIEKGYVADQEALAVQNNMTREYMNKILSVMDVPKFYRDKLAHYIPKAGNIYLIKIGQAWRAGMKKTNLTEKVAAEKLHEALSEHINVKGKLNNETGVSVLNSIFDIKLLKDEKLSIGHGEYKGTLTKSPNGKVTFTFPAGLSEDKIAKIKNIVGEG